jgi:hypothetical protein
MSFQNFLQDFRKRWRQGRRDLRWDIPRFLLHIWATPFFLHSRLWGFRIILLASVSATVGGWLYHDDFKTDALFPRLYEVAASIFGHHVV